MKLSIATTVIFALISENGLANAKKTKKDVSSLIHKQYHVLCTKSSHSYGDIALHSFIHCPYNAHKNITLFINVITQTLSFKEGDAE
jgi:hypothetical protein